MWNVNSTHHSFTRDRTEIHFTCECQVSCALLSTSTQVNWCVLLQKQLYSLQGTIYHLLPSSTHLQLKADNQTTRSVSWFHTPCLSMTLCIYTDKSDQICFTIKLLLLQTCRSISTMLFPLFLPNYCLIFSLHFMFKIFSFFSSVHLI